MICDLGVTGFESAMIRKHTPDKAKRGPKLLKLLVIVAVFLFAYDLVLFKWYSTIVARWAHGLDPVEAECAVILFSDFGEDWGLDGEAIRRCRHALRLFRNQQVEAVVCAGGNLALKGKSGSKLMFKWLSEHGMPQTALHREADSCDTLSNIRNPLRIMDRLGYSSALLVSSPLHLYRVSYLISREITPKGLTIHLAPYSYESIVPQAGVLCLFKQTHYEWLCLGLYLSLTKALYNRIIRSRRGCVPTTE